MRINPPIILINHQTHPNTSFLYKKKPNKSLLHRNKSYLPNTSLLIIIGLEKPSIDSTCSLLRLFNDPVTKITVTL